MAAAEPRGTLRRNVSRASGVRKAHSGWMGKITRSSSPRALTSSTEATARGSQRPSGGSSSSLSRSAGRSARAAAWPSAAASYSPSDDSSVK